MNTAHFCILRIANYHILATLYHHRHGAHRAAYRVHYRRVAGPGYRSMTEENNSVARRAWVVMGVAGCGKSTVAPRLCAALASDAALFGEEEEEDVSLQHKCAVVTFIEGDEHHPPGNVAKMSRGVPLTDEDRRPWLNSLAAKMREACSTSATANVVLACSALKRKHRATLTEGASTGDVPLSEVHFLHLDVSRRVLEERLEARALRGEHFFAPSLLQSQLDDLDVDDDDHDVVRVAADGDVERVVAAAIEAARGRLRLSLSLRRPKLMTVKKMSSSSSSSRPTRLDLDPSTLETTIGRFLDDWWTRLERLELHEEVAVAGRVIDHVCWRCSTQEEYDDALRALTTAGHSVAGSSVIGGRVISTVRLSTPVRWRAAGREWMIPAIEVPMPKPGRPKPNGFEHAEVALMTGDVRGTEALEMLRQTLIQKNNNVSWEDKGMRKDINPELSVNLGGGCCVKFHNRPLLEVVDYELSHGLATKTSTSI